MEDSTLMIGPLALLDDWPLHVLAAELVGLRPLPPTAGLLLLNVAID